MASNTQLDNYLSRRKGRFRMLPAQSYEELFTLSGNFKEGLFNDVRSGGPFSQPLCCIVNLDKAGGMGTHWVAIAIVPWHDGEPITFYYYDPLLPNATYRVPAPMREFIMKLQVFGGRFVSNLEKDQGATVESDEKRIRNVMCGAYCVLMLQALIANPTPENFFAMHDFLRKPDNVKPVFARITGGTTA